MGVRRSIVVGAAALLASLAAAFWWAAHRQGGHVAGCIPQASTVQSVAEVPEPVEQAPAPVEVAAYRAEAPRRDLASLPARLNGSVVPVPVSVRDVVAKTTSTGSPMRLAQVHALGARLGRLEREALYAFLLNPDRTDDLTPDQEYVLVNEIMKLLRQQDDHAPEFGAVLAAIFRDDRQDSVVRDYAIQHLGEWGLTNDFGPEFEEVLREALAETGSSIAGTALVSFDKLASELSSIPASVVADAALALAGDKSANAGSRAAALSICGARGVTNALPLARRYAQMSAVPLRVASTAFVGQYGDAADQEFLAAAMQDPLAVVAQSATAASYALSARTIGR